MPRCIVALAVALCLSPTSARADERPECGEAPDDAEVRRRLEVVSRHVREQEPEVRRWFTTFVFLHGTMASTAAIIAAASEDENSRNEMLVGMTGSVLAVASLLVFMPPLVGAGDQLRAYGEETPEERLRKLRAAEDILRRAAASAEFVHGWFPATATALYTTAASSFVLLGLERVTFAYTHVIGGSILGLGRLALRPVAARALWRRYSRRYPDAACQEVVAEPSEVSWRLHPQGLGMGLTIQF